MKKSTRRTRDYSTAEMRRILARHGITPDAFGFWKLADCSTCVSPPRPSTRRAQVLFLIDRNRLTQTPLDELPRIHSFDNDTGSDGAPADQP